MSTFRLCALASASVLLSAQESTRLAGPTSGLLFDAPSRSIRVVVGVPGAAYLGAAVASDLDNGSVSPDGRLAVAMSAGAASLITIADSSTVSLGDGCEGAIAWAADSSAVALGCTDGARLYRISKGAATRSGLAEFRGAKALAVDASGLSLFAAGADGIYRVDAESTQLLAPVEAASLALSGSTLYAAAGKQVIALDNLTGSGALRIVAGEGQGIEDPSAVGVSADGARLFVAERAAKLLKVFNPATSELLSSLELDFSAGRVDSLGNSLFLLNARKDATDTVQVFDARQLAVYFIPTQDLGSVANLED